MQRLLGDSDDPHEVAAVARMIADATKDDPKVDPAARRTADRVRVLDSQGVLERKLAENIADGKRVVEIVTPSPPGRSRPIQLEVLEKTDADTKMPFGGPVGHDPAGSSTPPTAFLGQKASGAAMRSGGHVIKLKGVHKKIVNPSIGRLKPSSQDYFIVYVHGKKVEIARNEPIAFVDGNAVEVRNADGHTFVPVAFDHPGEASSVLWAKITEVRPRDTK